MSKVAIAAIAVKSKVTKKFSTSSKDVPYDDVEGEERKSEQDVATPEDDSETEALFSCQDIIENPCLFLPIVAFMLAVIFGIIVLILEAVASDAQTQADAPTGILLLIIGLWAGWEVRSLGSLADQIKQLRGIRKQLASDTNRLEGEVGELGDENKELEQNVDAFREENEELQDTVKNFDKQNEELHKIHLGLEKDNDTLKDRVQGLSAQNTQLESTVSEMVHQTERLNGELKQFEGLRIEMEKVAEESGEDMMQLVQKCKATYEKMDNLMRDNEEVLLTQIAADIEFTIDKEEGLDEREWKRFLTRIPARYKEIIKEEGITFERFDPDGNGKIDPHHIQDLIQLLVKKHEAKEAQQKGAKKSATQV